jgi:hypothetical protein
MPRLPTDPLLFDHWQGERLRSRDLRDQLAVADELRTLHNRAAHGSFGVAFGLEVSVENRIATVECGVAYDCTGRELVLQQPRSIELPTTDAGPSVYLVLQPVEFGRETALVEAGTALRWLPAGRYHPRRGVPLLRLTKSGAGYQAAAATSSKVGGFQAPRVRGMSRLPMASGVLEGTRISWERVQNENGLEVKVDTSTAGFVSDRVAYRASLLWGKPNRRFSPPFVSIVSPTERGFVLRLLLPRQGAEAFEIVQGAALVRRADHAQLGIELGTRLHFTDGADFIVGDWVARLLPRSDRAWLLKSMTGDELELDVPVAGTGLVEGDLVVAANLPRTLLVLSARDAFPADIAAASAVQLASVAPGNIVLRESGSAAGAAARVSAKSGSALWLRSAVADLTNGDRLSLLGSPHAIASVGAGQNPLYSLEDGHVPSTGEFVLRVADITGAATDVSQEPPSTVSVVQTSGKFRLNPPLTLAPGEALAFSTGTSLEVASVGAAQARTLEVDRPDLLANRDLVRPTGALAERALVLGIDGALVTLSAAFATTPTAIDVADLSTRTTIRQAIVDTLHPELGSWFTIGNISSVRIDDLMVRLDDESAEVGVLSRFGSAGINLLPQIPGRPGDVLAVARFRRSAVVQNVLTGPPAIVVVDNAGAFAAGDTVARADANGTATFALIDQVAGSALVLRSPIEGLQLGQELVAVSLRRVSKVTGIANGKLAVEPAESFRAGDFVGRFAGWRDWYFPARLVQTSPNPRFDVWLDGLMPGDAVGLGELSWNQRTLRFSEGAALKVNQQLRLFGMHARTGQSVLKDVQVAALEGSRARLSFAFDVEFRARPEQLQAIDALATQAPERFAAYALEQGVRLAWFGCQLPAPAVDSCPLHGPAPCACCEDSDPETTPGSSGCCG